MLVGLTLLKAKREAEDKIKLIDEKLELKGYRTSQKMSSFQIEKPSNQKAEEWRKFSLSNNKLSYSPSNFDSELDRVNYFQEKCQNTLEDYVNFQQLLL